MSQNEKRPIDHFSVNIPVIPPKITCWNCGTGKVNPGLDCCSKCNEHNNWQPIPQPESTSPEDVEWMNSAMGPQAEAKPEPEQSNISRDENGDLIKTEFQQPEAKPYVRQYTEKEIVESYKGRCIRDKNCLGDGYLGSCSIEVHRSQLCDTDSWVHGAFGNWMNSAMGPQAEARTHSTDTAGPSADIICEYMVKCRDLEKELADRSQRVVELTESCKDVLNQRLDRDRKIESLEKELSEAKTKIKGLKELLKTIRSWPINIPLGILNLISEALR